MGKYIGPDNTYGVFQKQTISIVSNGNDPTVISEYALNYRVPTAAGLLVVSFGAVLEPDVDYDIIDGGKKIQLSWGIASQFYSGASPAGTILGEIFVVFLGKQLSVTNSRVLIQASFSDLIDSKLDAGLALSSGRVQVFKNGSLLRHGAQYTLEGTQIVFSGGSVASGDVLDIYVNVI
jgi:hypothetical protein